MNINQHLKLSVILLSTLVMSIAHADSGELTGKVKLACEAILCLSTGSPPGECSPSLSEYFSIDFDDFSDTIQGRINFLNLCPVSSETPQMKSLVNAIANGAGRCDAASLNAALIAYTNGLQGCIQGIKPAYCSDYEGHAYTDLHNGAHYVVTQSQTYWPFNNFMGGNSNNSGGFLSGFTGGNGQNSTQTCGHWVD
ncbi:MAG TPA: TrbM/KikA/MpfK family conjugal transfer protein [Methylotenera sp.]|nr:TrbM/KikA/MpfK family conjugal transfer protein [Methylotenera sp.]